jgi:hypothetical protein
MIAITGSSGRLGQSLLKIVPDAFEIKRTIPNEKFNVIIHAATPRQVMNKEEIKNFNQFNIELRKYCDRYKPHIINIGSCWQILQGSCYDTDYAVMKRNQSDLFFDAVTVIPYWIYGEQKGFIFDVKQMMMGNIKISSAGKELRDFIHVDDVAKDIINAIDYSEGTFASCTKISVSPVEILKKLGYNIPGKEPYPTAKLSYPIEVISNPQINLWDYISSK